MNVEAVGPILVVGYAVWYVTQRISSWRAVEPGTPEYVRQLYKNDEIDRREMERRLDVVMDPEADRIRRAAERVSGIGERTAWDLAAAYPSLRAVREATEEELQQVPNVGSERARAIREQL